MSNPVIHRTARRHTRGVALVITLAMLVLVTFAIVAFFSKATISRVIENSSIGGLRADVLSNSSVHAIIGEIQKEMLAGSNNTSQTPDVYGNYVLRPKTARDTVPQQILSSAIGTLPPAKFNNLVKQSVSTKAFFDGTGSTLKAVSARTGAPALDGRVISIARWNAPKLIGDSTGVSGFDSVDQLPEWVLVTRTGINSAVSIANAKDPNSKDFVIGRFAYNIYNEGGLLNLNVVGYPSAVAGSNADLLIVKGTPVGADLTQIPGIQNQSAVNKLIEWRNSAGINNYNSQSPNSLSGYTKLISQFSGTTGFLRRWISSDFSSSDQRFVSRQDLIRYIVSGNASPITDAALPYITTFSRTLNQPSIAPDFTDTTSPQYRAKIVDSGGTDKIGNAAYGSEPVYNPQFLTVTVSNTVTGGRNDGTDLLQGEPLVKKRFALDRLAWVTYKGPGSTLSKGDPVISAYITAGMRQEHLDQGTASNILKYFGLTWSGGNSTSGHWVYDHGISSSGRPIIGTLAAVRDQNREPDFFELLKASINVGSIAKATASSTSSPGNAETNADQRVDFQILQIGANMIDQFDPDGYPTNIQIQDVTSSGSPVVRNFFGKENLPYLNALHLCSTQMLTATGGTNEMVMEIPSIWNPVDAGSNFPSATMNPQQLRVTIVSSDPWNIVAPSANAGTVTTLKTDYTPSVGNTHQSSAYWGSRDSTAITFSNIGSLYREPTLLAQPNVPANSNLALGPDFNVQITTDSVPTAITGLSGKPMIDGKPMVDLDSNTFIGFPCAAVPYYDGSSKLSSIRRYGNGAGRTIRMEWSDGGSWQPYQELFWESSVQMYEGPQANVIKTWNSAGHTFLPSWDPRSSRFLPVMGQTTCKLTDASTSSMQTIRPGVGGGYGSNYSRAHKAAGWLPTDYFSYPGMAEQNNPNVIFSNQGAGSTPQYYVDPDGVARRAMAAYVQSNQTTGLPLASPAVASSRPIMLNRPFRSVGELGYVFRDTPWKNIDFFTPESGDKGLLDVFCISSDNRTDAIVAGRVDLNTRQAQVLQAVLAGAYRDEFNTAAVIPSTGLKSAQSIAAALVARTGQTPLVNISDLVGRYTGVANAYGQLYDGFSADSELGASGSTTPNDIIQRFRETAIRALSQAGDTRTWNLLIDLVVQAGRYTRKATDYNAFMVEGEKHIWVHVAIDRATGRVIELQTEVVNE